MNNMGNLAKGVQIGDGALAAYIEIGKAKRLNAGLFETTTENRYRVANTIHNTPREASFYSMMSKMDNIPMQSKRYFGGNLISAYNVDGIDIGWAYTTDINQNRLSRGVTTSANFDTFQELLRKRYFSNRKDDETPQLNAVVNKYGNDNPTLYGVGTVSSRLFDEIDFSLPVGKSENELLVSNFNNRITERGLLDYYSPKREFLFEKNRDKTIHGEQKIFRYNPQIQYGSSQSTNIDIYKVGGNNEFIEHVIDKDFGKNTKDFDYEEGAISTTSNNDTKNNIISKTDNLFKRGKINSLVNRFHTSGNTKDQLSRGRNLRKTNNESTKDGGYDNPYCRVWTSNHQYSTMKDLIRPFGGDYKDLDELQKKLGRELRPNNGHIHLKDNSVLQDNGFVRITPQLGDYKSDSKELIKNYMFSIENLAWKGSGKSLSPEQTGPNEGRIMWFPPYNLKFSENVNVNWNGNSFIGRGEQIYTYTNTERSGTLDFTLLIDHPSILNKWRGTRDVNGDEAERYKDTLLRFFAGCEMLDTTLNPQTENNEQSDEGSNDDRNLTPAGDNLKHIAYVIFFPNNYTGVDNKNVDDTIIDLWKYEMTNDETVINLTDKAYSGQTVEKNKNMFKLNNNGEKEHVKELVKKITMQTNEEVDVHNLGDLTKINRVYELDKDTIWDNITVITMTYHENKILYLYQKEKNTSSFYPGDKYPDAEIIEFSDNIKEEDENCILYLKNDSDYYKIATSYFTYKADFLGGDITIYDISGREIKKLFLYNGLYYDYDYEYDLNNNAIIDGVNFSDYEYDDDDECYHYIPEKNSSIEEWLKDTCKFETSLDENNYKEIYNIEYLSPDKGDKIFGLDKNQYSIKSIKYGGYASSHGNNTENQKIANNRSKTIKKIIDKLTWLNNIPQNEAETKIYEVNNDDINSKEGKLTRCGLIFITLEQNTQAVVSNEADITTITNTDNKPEKKLTTNNPNEVIYKKEEYVETGSYDNEYTYFSKIQEDDKMVTHIMKRVRHFDPAYHSLTPEGFNARLTFLQQCTRQGPTNSLSSGKVSGSTKDEKGNIINKGSNDYLKWAGNLSFGRAPYCVLRIGDFFNTKICIESISISYDNGGGLQWDLNPEGVGVQPMFANISITFKFLGGQDIAGPIEKLQNAVTSNYYANASVYDANAEYKKNKKQ